MKFIINIFVMLLSAAALVAAQKAVIVRYPKGTPQSAIDSAMRYIQQHGGTVTPLRIIK
jgi:hypothetical protein